MARKAGNTQPSVMAQNSTQSDRLFRGVSGKLPGFELLPNVDIEVEQSFVDEAKCGRCGHGFADRAGLEDSLISYRFTLPRDSILYSLLEIPASSQS
jgi:hypothetical protein